MEEPDLFDRINSCPGMKYFQLLLSHQTSLAIFAGNHRELKHQLDVVHDAEKSAKLFDMNNREQCRFVQNEIVRYFHNYVAAALTLVEHTRVVMRDDAVKESYRQVYQTRIDATFTNDSLSGFVQELRNYFLHRGLPSTGVQMNICVKTNKVDTTVFLDTEKMRDWDGWRSRGKAYLATQKGKLALMDVVDTYTAKVRGFHEWFEQWFMDTHKAELTVLKTLQDEWNKGLEYRK